MSEVDLPLLQAQVTVQGLMIQVLTKTNQNPDAVRRAFSEELLRLMPTLSPDMMSFVTIHADRMLRHLPKAGDAPLSLKRPPG